MNGPLYRAVPGRHDSWEVRCFADPANVQAVMDSIPNQAAAESIAVELDRAYRLGYRECSWSIRRTLDLYQ